MNLPAVRFIRIFDAREMRMRNIWQRIASQERLDNAPQATEITVTAQTVAEAMVEIRRFQDSKWITPETIAEIEKASRELVEPQESTYEVETAR